MSIEALPESPVLPEPTEDLAPKARRSGGDVRSGEFVSEHLQMLYGKLQALEKLVQEARAREAAAAIRWIRQAIQTYGLDASDLAV